MKKNNLLKIFSAAAIVSTLSVVELSKPVQNSSVYAANKVESKVVTVPATVQNAYEENKDSMAKKALVKVTVQKVDANYKYTVTWRDITFAGMSDGISRFWVEGTEVPLQAISGEGNPKTATFTLSELKSKLNIEVFVKTMESIMPGGGRKKAILKLDTSVAEAEFNKPAEKPKPENPKGENPKPENPKAQNPQGEKPQGENPKPEKPQGEKPQGKNTANLVTYYDGVIATLMHAHENRPSMGNAALDGVTVYKKGDTYHYVVYFKDLKLGKLTDGITKFWVNGVEYPVVKTGGANNQVRVHFTSNQKLNQIPVSVFVQTMENIMPGGGKQNAILTFNWSNAKERKGEELPGLGGDVRGTLPNTGLETSSTLFAGAVTLLGAILLGRRKQR